MNLLRGILGAHVLFLIGCMSTCGYSPEDEQPEDADRDGWDDWDDCDDYDSSVNPGANEHCDGVDEDCDGSIDEDAVDAAESHVDADGDGYGDPDGTTVECDPPRSYVMNGRDCDDRDASSHPGATERCDGADNDCDGRVDADAADPPIWYADADGDGYGDSAVSYGACEEADGYVANDDDCDDTSALMHPGYSEVCGNGLDDDCAAYTGDACTYETVELTASSATLVGRTADEEACAAVSGAGDVDDDGYDDLLVGASGTGAGTEGAYWARGPISGTLGLGLADAHLEGLAPGDGAGASVAAAGDVDDDGLADVLFGAPLEADGATAPGAAWLRYGPQMTGCEPFCDGAIFVGTADAERAGASVAGPGDVDGDGYDDVVVGAPGRAGGGGAYLVTGTPSGSVSLADADAILVGEGSGRAGDRVYRAGDIDSDGYADFAVLDPTGGLAWIVTGRPSGTVQLSDASVRVLAPTIEGGQLGSLALADLDGDGTVDLIAGSKIESDRSTDAVAWGALGPLSGAVDLASAELVVTSGGLYANAGVEVAAGGDLDLDGVSDVLFGASASEALLAPDHTTYVDVPGSVFVRYGPWTGGLFDLGGAALRIGGAGLDEVSVGFVGDLDRDGHDELAIGAPRDDTEGTNAGACYVYSGAGL
ncbi:MAG: MopE-related protein [Myxococcota bacterium]